MSDFVCDEIGLAQAQWVDTFCGRPPWRGEGVHLTGFAGIVCRHAATLAVCELAASFGQGARADALLHMLERGLLRDICTVVQRAAAGGWVAVKPFVQGGRILCDVLGPGQFVPLRFAGAEVEDAAFLDFETIGGKQFVRRETHILKEEGSVHIQNRAFEILRGGQRAVPLAQVPRWAHLAENAVIENARRPLFGVLRMPFANHILPGSPVPPALYAPGMDTLRELDRVYTEFLWEIKTGRRKQILDATAVLPTRRGRRLETDDQYLVLDMGGGASPFDDYTPNMRIEAYQRALDLQLRLLENQCGFSAQTFHFDVKSGGGVTATEVVSRNTQTFNTVRAIQENGLRHGLLAVMEVYGILADLYHLAPAGVCAPGVQFGDGVFEDTGTEFARRKALADGGYISGEELVEWYFGAL